MFHDLKSITVLYIYEGQLLLLLFALSRNYSYICIYTKVSLI